MKSPLMYANEFFIGIPKFVDDWLPSPTPSPINTCETAMKVQLDQDGKDTFFETNPEEILSVDGGVSTVIDIHSNGKRNEYLLFGGFYECISFDPEAGTYTFWMRGTRGTDLSEGDYVGPVKTTNELTTLLAKKTNSHAHR